MKYFLFIILQAAWLYSVVINAQVLNTPQIGVVRSINSEPISGVDIHFSGAQPTKSDVNGRFRLVFPRKKPGDVIFLKKIYRPGYELVNNKALERITITRNGQLSSDIILAKTGVINDIQQQYYRALIRIIEDHTRKKTEAFRLELASGQITQSIFIKKSNALLQQAHYKTNTLKTLSDRIARNTPYKATKVYEETLVMLKNGRLKDALQKLLSNNLLKQAKREFLSIKGTKTTTEKWKQISMMIDILADLHMIDNELDKGLRLYEQFLDISEGNSEVLQKAVDFYLRVGAYPKALQLYFFIASNPTSEDWQIANAQAVLAEVYFYTGKYSLARINFERCLTFYENAFKNDNSKIFYKKSLAIALAKLGKTYAASEQIPTSLLFYKKSLKHYQEIQSVCPANIIELSFFEKIKTLDINDVKVREYLLENLIKKNTRSISKFQSNAIAQSTLKSVINFLPNVFKFSNVYKAVLDDIASTLKTDKINIKLQIQGHTDNREKTGSASKKLSEERAQRVKQYLVSKGIKAARLLVIGYGSSRPLANNNTVYGRKKNRRVEIKPKD